MGVQLVKHEIDWNERASWIRRSALSIVRASRSPHGSDDAEWEAHLFCARKWEALNQRGLLQ